MLAPCSSPPFGGDEGRSLDQERLIRLLGFTRYTTSTLRSTAMLGPSHPDTKVRCTGDDDTPLKT